MASVDDRGSSVSKVERNHGDSFDSKKDDQKSAKDVMLNGEVLKVSVDEIDVSVDIENERNTIVNDTDGEGFGYDEYMNLNPSVNGGSDESLEDSGNKYQIGDFVWGKIKSHPWWPGQIYDSNDASDAAIKHSRDGCLLVAFFGDGSWSWCLPSQLIPFTENFNEKMINSSSKFFLKAVHAAVDEVGRILEFKMTCNCVSIDKRENLARRVISNSGVKAGIPIPDVDIKRLSIPDNAAADILAKVNSFATSLSAGNLLELAVLRGWLAAMLYAKGERELPEYRDYDVEGLEDMNDNAAEVTDDFSVPIEVPILGPTDEDWHSPPAVNDLMTQEAMTDKIYHRRKQKSVADLMREDNGVKASRRNKPSFKERKDSKKSSSSVEQKCGFEDRKQGNRERVSSRGKIGTKRKFVVSESLEVISRESSKAGNVDLRIEVGAKEGGLAGKPNSISIATVENDYGKAVEDSNIFSTPRERKKSKYLSPPYISPRWNIGTSSFKLESELGKTSKKDEQSREDHEFKASETPSLSHQDVANSSSNDKVPGSDLIEQNKYACFSSSAKVDVDKMSFSTSDVVTPVNEVLSGIQAAAIDPLYLSREGTLDVVSAFTSAFRSSTYVHVRGGKNEENQRQANSKKRKSSLLKLGKEEEKFTDKLNDDIMLDVQLIRQKFEIMGAILENYQLKFSMAQKHILKDEIKCLMESVEAASEKMDSPRSFMCCIFEGRLSVSSDLPDRVEGGRF